MAALLYNYGDEHVIIPALQSLPSPSLICSSPIPAGSRGNMFFHWLPEHKAQSRPGTDSFLSGLPERICL